MQHLKPRKIGIFVEAWDFGGICTFCRNLGAGLSEAGHDVTFILATAYKARDGYARKAYDAMRGSARCAILDLNLKFVPRAFRLGYVKRRIIDQHFDGIFLNNPDRFLSLFHELSSTQRLISVTHGDLASGTYRTFAETQRFCRRHVAISQAIHDTLLSMSPPQMHHEIRLIRHGVPQNAHQPGAWFDESLRVVYCGRFDLLQKRIRDLPLLWKAFLRDSNQGVLHLIGAGDGEDFLRQNLREEIRGNSVVMHGYLPPTKVPDVLRQCEIMLNLSNWEGLPLSVLEGMACACYPVLSNIRSGHPDILDACGGTTFATGDVEQVAQILAALARDKKSLLARRAEIQRQAQKHFSESAMTERYCDLIENL